MSILGSIGKGFRFFLMSMGVSTYAKKDEAAGSGAKPAGSKPIGIKPQ